MTLIRIFGMLFLLFALVIFIYAIYKRHHDRKLRQHLKGRVIFNETQDGDQPPTQNH